MTLPPAPHPCDSCPYRRDVPAGVWSADEYVKLLAYDQDTPYQPAALFQCHQHDRGDSRARLCAGWVGVHGSELLALRLAVADSRVDPGVMDYTTTTPLFASGAEAAAHGMAEIEQPSAEAVQAMAKIQTRRADTKGES